ncbi:MAG: zinc ribbon domain-containing protein [Leptothrix sp. (in: b-proteobacteria)]|jgi:putative FmdB family regulatory protein
MPIYDYHCKACAADFELLVRSSTVPACPKCSSTELEKTISPIAPAGKIEAIRLSNRRAADAQGHFNHYSPSERARLLKGKRV